MPSWGSVMGMGLAGFGALKAHETGIDEVLLKSMGLEVPAINGKHLIPLNIDTRGIFRERDDLSGLQKELGELHRTIEDLSKSRYQQGPMVIHTGQSAGKGWYNYIIPVTVAGGVLYLYVRLRGGSIMDLMFVTRNSLQSFRGAVSDSFGRLWEELRRQKDELAARLAGVSAQQEALLKQQEELLNKQGSMDKKLEDIQDSTSGIEFKVDDMGNSMMLMQHGVERANQGIFMLCAAVAEVTRHVGLTGNQGASTLLNSYVEQATLGVAAPPGPAGLLTQTPNQTKPNQQPSRGFLGLLGEASPSTSSAQGLPSASGSASSSPNAREGEGSSDFLMMDGVSGGDSFLGGAAGQAAAGAGGQVAVRRDIARGSSIWNYIKR